MPTPKERKEIQRLIDKWRPRLFLSEWYFNLEYPTENCSNKEGYNTLADISPDVVYLNALIRVYPAFFKKSKQAQEEAIVHELCHCITQYLWDTALRLRNGYNVHEMAIQDEVERATQRIANVALKNFWEKK
jgi:hypothetical protein